MICDALIKQIIEKKSPIVVGLDPRLESMPKALLEAAFEQYGETLEGAAECILYFNKGIIDAVADLVPAVKPQIAFYEQYGIPGLTAYSETCKYAREKGLIVIADIKRGDIGTTSKAYSLAHLGKVKVGKNTYEPFSADYATINPYLGDDCHKEFMDEVKAQNKGLFILVKTSNPTSGQLQDIETDEGKVYEHVARMVKNWGEQIIGESGYSPVGAVVGATYPKELETLRKAMPRAIFLVPGYGAQGGKAEDIVGAFNEDGLGAIVNNSRGILYAYEGTGMGYQEAAREQTLKMKEAINQVLENSGKKYW